MEKTAAKRLIDSIDERTTSLEIYRDTPEVIGTGDHIIIVKPVSANDHPDFMNDFFIITAGHAEIFEKCDWLIEKNLTDENSKKDTASIMLFNNSKVYKHFIQKALPRFFRKWAFTFDFKKEKLIKISKKKMKAIMKNFEIDELIKAYLFLYYFNYGILKKNCKNILEEMGTLLGISGQTFSNTTPKNTRPPLKPLPGSVTDALSLNLSQTQKRQTE